MHFLTHPTGGGFIRLAACCCCVLTLGGCVSFGGDRLEHDQLAYARSIDRSQKQQTLSNIVSLRYADTPTFLPVTSVIAGYGLDRTANGLFTNVFGGGLPSTGQLGASVTYSNHPTFTFTPTSGEDFAEDYIRPMVPSLILPLVQNGVPIDVLFRIAVQSIGELQNSAALAGSANNGSPKFFELIHAFRRLQLKSALAISFVKDADGSEHVYLEMDESRADDDSADADATLARKLLHIPAGTTRIEILYGSRRGNGKAINVLTRSVIGMLTELGGQIQVPDEDVESNATLPTVHVIGGETRPPILINVGQKAPEDAYVSTSYGKSQYWIDGRDFDSKFAFSAVQTLIALAQTSRDNKGPLVTIPAN